MARYTEPQMSYFTAPFDLIAAIHSALLRPARPYSVSMASWAQRQEPHGWVLLSQVWDKLEEQDSRLYFLSNFSESLCEVFDLPLRKVLHRPASHLSDSLAFEGLTTPDAASLMICLNELGFHVDPTALVERLLPAIQESQLLTEAQWDVLFFAKRRDRATVTLQTQSPPTGGASKESRAGTGHAFEFRQEADAAKLTVRGPRYRPRPRVKRTCEVCRQEFWHGDLDSLLAHRQYHQRYQRSHKPKVLPALVQRAAQGREPEVVDQQAPHWLHSEVYERAVWFKREMGYDHIQWELGPADEPPAEEALGYVFTTEDEPGRIVGACAFREREQETGPPLWTMDWAWIAPAWRRSGVLARHWPRLAQRFGDFPLEYPLSAAMEAFLMKQGTPVQRARARELQGLTRHET